MKIKDIEKNLKKESETIAVPDVYARVKRAPINRLLSDPVHVFRHKMVMRMLVFACIILLVAALGCSAILLAPSRVTSEEFGYVRVVVNGETVYGFVVNDAGNVLATITESDTHGVAPKAYSQYTGKNIEDAVDELYQSNLHDEVVVSAIFATRSLATTMVKNVRDSIDSQESGAHVVKGTVTKAELLTFVNANTQGEALALDSALDDILNEYIEISVALL